MPIENAATVARIRSFLAVGRDHCEQRCRIDLWGVLAMMLVTAGEVEEQERHEASRLIRQAFIALQRTGTYEPEMVALFEGAMRSLPRPNPDDAILTMGEDAALQGLANVIVNLIWAREGEAAAANAWWQLYPTHTPPWRLSPEEQARPALPN